MRPDDLLPTGRLPSEAGRRWDSLDALRGIAAFLVVIFHCSQVTTGFATTTQPLRASTWLEPWAWFKFTPLRLLVSSGPPAVVLFFLLSGFVLSLPFLRPGNRPGYASFCVKRVCRIYPPFAAAILVSATLYGMLDPHPIASLSEWFNETLWDRPLSARYVLDNLMMTGLRHDMTLDLVMWSLVHELRISLIFPALFILTRAWPSAMVAGSIMLSIVATIILGGNDADTVAMSMIDTCRFVFLFVGGIVIAAHASRLKGAVSRLPSPLVPLLVAVAAALLLFPGPSYSRAYNFVWGAGAAGLVILAIGSARVDRVLISSPLLWLGRVSYSLYLIHVPILIATVHLTWGVLPLWLTLTGVVVLSLVIAEAMYRLIEEPSIRLGRFLTKPGLPAGVPLAIPARREDRR